MFEAYKVGVTLALNNQVTRGLGLISRDLIQTSRHAKALQATLNEITLVGLKGGVLMAGGFMGLGLIGKAIKPAEEYASQLNRMNLAGMKQLQIAQSIQMAWQNTSDVITTTATGNLKTVLDLRNVIGADKGMGEVHTLLPIVSQIQAVMAASSNMRLSTHSDDIAFGMAKALDIIGAVRSPAQLEKEAAMMSKVISAMQGRVTPQQYQSVFNYARQARYGLSDEFKYEILPSLMLENANKGGGGGSRGIGPALAAFYRLTNQGYVNQKSVADWKAIGYVDPSTALKTTTTGTTVGAMKDAAGAASNPFLWTTSLVSAIRATYGANITDDFIRQKLNELFRGNQLAATLAVEFFTKQKNFERDQNIIRSAMPYKDAYVASLANNPGTVRDALNAQVDNLGTAAGITLIPIMLPAMRGLTRFFNVVGQAMHDHPLLATFLTSTATALSGLAIAAGTGLVAAAGIKLFATALGVSAAVPFAAIASGLTTVALGLGAIAAIVADAKDPNGFTQRAANWIYRNTGGTNNLSLGERLGNWLVWGSDTGQPGYAPQGGTQRARVDVHVRDPYHLAKVVTDAQVKQFDKPSGSGAGFDGRQTPVWPSYSPGF